MTREEMRNCLDWQGWRCPYCGSPIEPHEEVTLTWDNQGLVHADCAVIGRAPEREAA